jgi:hypothetical protein
MKQHLSKQSATILSILLFSIAILLSGSVFAAKPAPVDIATQAELDAAIATVNSKISDITPPVRTIGDVLSDNSIVFWIDETGQHGLAAQPSDADVSNWYGAKEAAENYGPGWRLPTKHELNLLHQQKDVVGGFVAIEYWSSTELNAESAWYQYFPPYSGQSDSPKQGGYYSVRAVRNF